MVAKKAVYFAESIYYRIFALTELTALPVEQRIKASPFLYV